MGSNRINSIVCSILPPDNQADMPESTGAPVRENDKFLDVVSVDCEMGISRRIHKSDVDEGVLAS